MNLRYLSLFSGIGGFEVGIHRVFPNATCVGYSEINPNALKIYNKHFPDHPYLGSVKDIDVSKIPPYDLLVGGSPCQDLSHGNIRKKWVASKTNPDKKSTSVVNNIHGKKSVLFFEFVRILKQSKPRYFILENVASMKIVDRDIISELLGVHPIKINSRLFAPQNRQRLFWTNIGGVTLNNDFELHPFASIMVSVKNIQPYIIENIEKQKNFINYFKKMEKYGSVLGESIINSKDEYSTALLSGRRMWIFDERVGLYRKMTPEEAERLQTFPDGWTAGLSYTNRFKVLGNAVTCNVIKFIVEHLK